MKVELVAMGGIILVVGVLFLLLGIKPLYIWGWRVSEISALLNIIGMILTAFGLVIFMLGVTEKDELKTEIS